MDIKIGVCEWSLPVNGPFSVKFAAEAGFEGIQIGDLGGAGEGFPMNNKVIQEGYMQAAEDYNVVLQSLHPYGLQRDGTMLFPLDTPKGKEGMLSIKKCIDACSDMKIPKLMISSFFATLVRNQWDFEVFAEHLKFACKLGRDKGVEIVYESVLSTQLILKMIEIVSDELKICYDTLNPVRWGTGDPLQEIGELGLEHIDHFHVKDAPHDLKGYSLIGKGRSDFEAIMKIICDLGFEGWLISENYYTHLAAKSGENILSLAAEDIKTIKDTLLAVK